MDFPCQGALARWTLFPLLQPRPQVSPCRESGRKNQMLMYSKNQASEKSVKNPSPTRKGKPSANQASKSFTDKSTSASKPRPSVPKSGHSGPPSSRDSSAPSKAAKPGGDAAITPLTPANSAQAGSSSASKPGPLATKAPLQTSTSNPAAPKRRVNASTAAYRERRSAFRLLHKLGSIPKEELAERDKSSLEWAKQIIAQRGDTKRPDPVPASKRQRSTDEPAPSSKRTRTITAKTSQGRSFSDVAKDYLVWAVVDRSNVDCTISPSNWRLVELALLQLYTDVVLENPGPSPSCRDAGWYQGHVKLIACADQRSADLYKLAVSRLGEVWPGARLEAIPKDEIPNRPRSRTWIPTEPSKPDDVIKLIRLSNLNLPTQNWKVARVGEVKGYSRQALIILDEESLAPLAERQGVINYGFGTITLKVYRKDQMGDKTPSPVEQQPREEAVASTSAEPAPKHL